MDPVTGAIGKLVPMLVDLLRDEYKLHKGVKLQVKSLSRELEGAQAALWNLAEAPPERLDPQVLLWARGIREASYDMVDILDTFQARIEGSAQTQLGKLFDLSMYKARRRISRAIEGITVQLKEVNELRGRYTFDSILGNRVVKSVTDPSTASVYKDVTRLVGINMARTIELLGDGYTTPNLVVHQQITRQLVRVQKPVGVMVEDMKKLHDWIIVDNKKKLGVLSIVGFGGVGKTTVALDLYREYGDQFQRRAMVTVSQNSDADVILRNILGQVKPQASDGEQQGEDSIVSTKTCTTTVRGALNRICMHTSNQQSDRSAWDERHRVLKAELEKCLANRYLLLIDDVWSSPTWQIIRRYFPNNENGSRIIVTTRFQAVATTCCVDEDSDIVHPVKVLSYDDSKTLFQKSLSECSVSGDNIPDRVFEICGGLPLAIVTLAGLVASSTKTTTSREEWIKVCDSLFPKTQVCRKPVEFMRILNHCYSDLDSDLRTCSLYLSIFPKGCKISRTRLIRRWISEGFISEKQGLSVEDVAETYFNQLITRKIIRPVQHSSNGLVKSCQVHDMVLEYLISKAAEEDFVTVDGSHWSAPTRSNKVRRLSVHSSDTKRAKKVHSMNLSHVRSLTMFGSLDKLLFKSFKTGVVQVLDLQGCKGFKDNHVQVSEICKMILLKYLNLRRTDIKDLPPNICKLKYLETLDIRETEVEELPKTIGQLERISNILGGNKKTRKGLKLHKDIKMDTMNNTLRVLSGIEIIEGSTFASNLHDFTVLRKLAIYKLYNDQAIFKDLLSSIHKLCSYSLQTLVIDDESSDFHNALYSTPARPTYLSALELSGKLLKLPAWIEDLNDLTKLTLSVTVLRTDNLVRLRKLPQLFSLTFSISTVNKSHEMAAAILEKNKLDSGGEIFVPAGGFRKLKLLRIFVPLLPSLNFSRNGTPELQRIELGFKRMEGLHGMDKLRMLQDVLITVEGEGSEPTKSILEDLKLESSKSKYTLIFNEYHD